MGPNLVAFRKIDIALGVFTHISSISGVTSISWIERKNSIASSTLVTNTSLSKYRKYKFIKFEISKNKKSPTRGLQMSGKRDSNSRPQPWQGCALPTELLPQQISTSTSEEEETRTPTVQLPLPPQSSASTNSATSPACHATYERIVPRTGLEPARLAAHAPETCASTNSATWANEAPFASWYSFNK